MVIFEELKLKKPIKLRKDPNRNELKKIDNIYYYYNEKLKKNTYWQKNPVGRIVQVNQFGELVYSGNGDYQKNIPKKPSLKKYKTDIMIHTERIKALEEKYTTWWVKDKNGKLIQVNNEEEGGIGFTINSWVRDEAIKAVDLNLRSLKKKAYECSKKELMILIKEEESKIIKKNGWKAVRATALSVLGLSWLPFI